jgi:transposase
MSSQKISDTWYVPKTIKIDEKDYPSASNEGICFPFNLETLRWLQSSETEKLFRQRIASLVSLPGKFKSVSKPWDPIALIHEVASSETITDSIVAIDMTGIYHRPVQRAFRQAGFDTRIVHPFATKHFLRPLHPGQKTDDYDLEAIFHAAVKGYGLATLPSPPVYQSLQAVSRHRHNLIKQQARLKVQIRRLLHMTMPGYADLWEDDKLFSKSIALPIASKFTTAQAIARYQRGESFAGNSP